MQNDKDKLKVDLTFLDESKSPVAETRNKTGYKVNWRNIIVIGGGIAALIGYITLSDNPPQHSYATPIVNNSGTVNNGQFSCSRYDSGEADKLSPANEGALAEEKRSLEFRENVSNDLKRKIDATSVSQYSDQSAIDAYNQMIDQYNSQLTMLKADMAGYQVKIDQFNAQVQLHNNYLLTHCRSGG